MVVLRDTCFRENLPIDHALSGHVMVAFVGTNCSPRLRSQDSIDGTMIVPSASKSALRRYDRGSIAVGVSVSGPALIVVPIVTIRIVAIRIRVAVRIRIISVIWEW